MSPKCSSLAFDETLKEFNMDHVYEPRLEVIVNEHYIKTSSLPKMSMDVMQVRGSVTISF